MIDALKVIGKIEPERVREVRDWLLWLFRGAAQAARGPLILSIVALGVNVITGVIGFFYLRGLTSNWPLFTTLGLLAVPVVLLITYIWIFRLIVILPGEIMHLSDALYVAVSRFQQQSTFEPESQPGKRSLMSRINELKRYSRLAWDLYQMFQNSQLPKNDTAPIHTLAMMVLPVFWIGFTVAMVLTVAFAILLPAGCLVHYLIARATALAA